MQAKIAQELLKKVKSDYEKIAEEFSASRNHEWKDFDKIKKYFIGKNRVIDIGCGNGRLRNNIEKNSHYIGIDNNEKFLKKAKKKFPNDEFINGDLLNIPIGNETCDVVFCLAVLHHIPSKEFREKAIKELKRIVKNDGYTIIMVWNLWQKKYFRFILKSIWQSIRKKIYDWNDVFIPWAKKIDRYCHAFTASELKKLLKKEFKIISLEKSRYNFTAVCQKK